MEVIAAGAAWAISSACQNVPAASDWLGRLCPANPVTSQLASRLSANAQIYLPGSSDFEQATKRWSADDAPDFQIVVVPETADDVAEAVKFANEVEMPFLTQSGGHGSISSLGQMRGGMEIYLERLNSVEIDAESNTVKIGGGTLTKAVTDALWKAGKQTGRQTCAFFLDELFN